MKTNKFLRIFICFLCISSTGGYHQKRKQKRISNVRPIVRVRPQYRLGGRSDITDDDYSVSSNESPFVSGRILSLNYIKPEQAPYVVAIFDEGQQIGVGSIIRADNGNTVILTTAECVSNDPEDTFPDRLRDKSRITVKAGVLDITNIKGEDYTQLRYVTSITRHNGWIRPSINDIAIIFLEVEFEYGRYAQPIALPPKPEIYPPTYPPSSYNDSLIYTTGWNLYIAQPLLNAVDINDCKKIYAENYKKDIVERLYALCAIDTVSDGTEGPCIGESSDKDFGVPAATIDKESDEFYLAGVFSFRGPGEAAGCGPNKYPAIYTKVSNFLDWIEENSIPPDDDAENSARGSELRRPQLMLKPEEGFEDEE